MVMNCLKDTNLSPFKSRWIVVLRHSKAEAAVRREAASLLPQGSWEIEARFGTLDRLYAAADAIFVGGGGKGRGVHDLLAPLSHGHPPLCFLDRGDPGAVGRTLAPLGLVLPLDSPVRSTPTAGPVRTAGSIANAGLRPPPWAWSKLLAEFDGRASATAWFERWGVL